MSVVTPFLANCLFNIETVTLIGGDVICSIQPTIYIALASARIM